MAGPNFIDYIKICCRTGKGGAGSAHLRREKYVDKGGPDGGDGGSGGNIILKGNAQLWTLLHLRYTKHVIAPDGEPGGKSGRSGANGKDVILEVPLGTIAKDEETNEVNCEILQDGETCILLKGGRGGLGNVHFKSPTNQTPRYAQPGEPGQESWKALELKVLADVGLVGYPNAGKSTLLSVLSAAKPKIGDYPFTTIVPNLGIVPYRNEKSFVMADIPGIIEGAHKGKGLGTRFLRHIERNAVLLFLVPADSENVSEEYHTLLNEIKLYNPELLDKERLLAVTKADMLDEELRKELRKEIEKQLAGVEWLFISAVANEGLQELKDRLWKKIHVVQDK